MTTNSELDVNLETSENQELRIGVFVCYCGVNIGGFLDVPAVCEYAKTLPDVSFRTSEAKPDEGFEFFWSIPYLKPIKLCSETLYDHNVDLYVPRLPCVFFAVPG